MEDQWHTAGTVMVKDISPGPSNSSPGSFTACNGKVFFSASTSATGVELWSTDGTSAGTTLVKDIALGTPGSSPFNMVCCNGQVIFAATGAQSTELWKTDGTAAGTVLVADLTPEGRTLFEVGQIKCVGNRVYFQANVDPLLGGSGAELYVTDGTAAGTQLLCDLYPGASNGAPTSLTLCDGRLYFAATHPTMGTELFVVTDPGASAEPVGQSCGPSWPHLASTGPSWARYSP